VGQSTETIVRLARSSLERVIGSRELFAVGFGDVGSSLYYALGATALYALGATPIALLIAGLVFLCTALSYAELSTTFPEPGGSATFSRYAFNDLISFIAGWGLLLDYIMTIAISSFTITPYLKHVLPLLHIPYNGGAVVHITATVAIIAFIFVINLIGMKFSGWFSFLLAVFTVVTQAGVVIIGGLFLLNLPFVLDHMRIGVTGASWSPDWWQFMKGTAVAMVAYTGIEAISQLAAETKQPGITIPRAIKWTVAVVLFLYLGISFVGLSVISPQELGTRYIEDPVVGIVLQFPVGGELIAPWIGLIAAVILLIASNAGLIGCSRLIFSMGEHYQVPNFFYKLHRRFRTPYVALAVFAALAAIVVIASRNQMLFLVDLYNFGAQIAFFAAHLSLIILRCKEPALPRPYRAPFNIPIGNSRSIPITAIIGMIASFAVWLIVVITRPEGRIVGLSWLAIGTAMYFYYRRKKGLAPTGRLKLEDIAIPEYQAMHIKNILVAARSIGGTDALQMACQLARHHHAQMTAVYVLEVPHSMPMDAGMEEREKSGALALKRAEAVAREYNIAVQLKFVRSRSIEEALLSVAKEGACDLIIVSADQAEIRNRERFATQAEKLLENASCRVVFCKS